MNIRTATLADEPAVIELWIDAGLIHGDLVDRYRADYRSKVAYQPELLLLAEEDERLQASVMAGYDGRRGWINCLAVRPERQGKGLGTQLVRLAEEKLTALGCLKINLQVRSSNTGVMRFYERLGYRVDEVVSMGKRTHVD
jgi:ribosomal protein S18 acetylase RimI-like enzyme